MKTEENGTDEGYRNSAAIKKQDSSWRRLGVAALALVSLAAAAAPEMANNSLDMPLVRVPAGEFMMGSDETPDSLAADYPQYDRERFLKLNDEAPVHRVRITRDFFFGKTEVTVGQFRRFIEQSGYVPESVRDGTGGYGYNRDYDPEKSVRGDAFEGRDPKYSWRNPGFAQTDDHPVTNVTWNDAVAMAKWLSEKEGVRYRLPTEAEWEYAARAGTSTRYSFGDDERQLDRYAWHGGDFQTGGHHSVGTKQPNPWGLHDVHGNVWEWVQDWYDADYYARSPAVDPQGPQWGTRRVVRGGSWHATATSWRTAFRRDYEPDYRGISIGLRLVRTV